MLLPYDIFIHSKKIIENKIQAQKKKWRRKIVHKSSEAISQSIESEFKRRNDCS